ncbi:hypothetical protein M413DRAFT_325366 [Hebeloma cylindrosporum]|uniref:Uncharacterized protein n=1 Tax=Hebeloma cylindrosporum TaxID=76867 RepID=A0A0C2XD48_HEBCY|nr:hypothetical protein M413DRAFT_325366 [Hebeloma cylindrosporum h7]
MIRLGFLGTRRLSYRVLSCSANLLGRGNRMKFLRVVEVGLSSWRWICRVSVLRHNADSTTGVPENQQDPEKNNISVRGRRETSLESRIGRNARSSFASTLGSAYSFSFLDRDRDNTSLMKVVYRDGVLYYLYLFVLSCINIIIVKTLPEDYQPLLSLVERMLHSILTSRVILHIRAQAVENPAWSDGLTELSTISIHIS